MEEQWKPASGYEDDYMVSDKGRVMSMRRGKTKILKPILERWNGYRIVTLYDSDGKSKKVKIGRLVALAFIPNPRNLPCVHYKDEMKTNDAADNLEWQTKAYINTRGASRQRSRDAFIRNYAKTGKVLGEGAP